MAWRRPKDKYEAMGLGRDVLRRAQDYLGPGGVMNIWGIGLPRGTNIWGIGLPRDEYLSQLIQLGRLILQLLQLSLGSIPQTITVLLHTFQGPVKEGRLLPSDESRVVQRFVEK